MYIQTSYSCCSKYLEDFWVENITIADGFAPIRVVKRDYDDDVAQRGNISVLRKSR